MPESIGYAALSVIPVVKDIGSNLGGQLGPGMVSAGRKAGSDFTSGMAAGMNAGKAAVDQAAARLALARDKEADAAGKVRVAEEKLNEVRSKTNASGSQIAAAEERLATARRNQAQASKGVEQSFLSLTDAEGRANQSAGAAGAAAEVAGSRFAGMGTKVADTAAKMKTFALAAGAGIGLLGKQAFDSASALEQSTGAVESVFGAASTQVLALAGNASSSVGLAKNQYNELASVLGSQLGNLGVSQDQVVGTTDSLIAKGADLAATFGGTTAEAVEALSSLFRGETDPIERYGVSIKAADVSARLAAQGLSNLEGPALQQAETQARLAILTEQTAKAQGAFARESDTAAGAQQRFGANLENAKASLGQALLPVVAQTATALQGLAGFTQQNTGLVQGLVIGVAALAAGVLAVNAATVVWAATQAVIRGATAAWTAVQWLLNAALTANPIGIVVVALTALVAGIVLAYQNSETFRNIVTAAWDGIKTAAAAAWDGVLKPTLDFFVGALVGVGDKATWLWQNAIQPAFDGVGSIVSGAWNNVISPTFELIKSGVGFVGDAFSAVGGVIAGAWDAAMSGVRGAAHFIGGVLTRIPTKIGPISVPGAESANNLGRSLQALRSGGQVVGPGTGTSDSILGMDRKTGTPTAWVSNGEFVVNEKAYKRFGPLVRAINAGVDIGKSLGNLVGKGDYDGRMAKYGLQEDNPLIDLALQGRDLLRLAGGGVVSANELIDFAKGVEGQPYVWGGVNWGDCSGAVSALANKAAGLEPFGSRFATGNQGDALAALGARPGLGPSGSLSFGWFNGGPYGGHTAATLPDGTHFEMGGARGDGQFGGPAAGADDPMFTDHMHFPPEFFLGLDAGVPTTGPSSGASALGTSGLGGSGGLGGSLGAGGGAASGGGGGSAGGSNFGGSLAGAQSSVATSVFVTNWPSGVGTTGATAMPELLSPNTSGAAGFSDPNAATAQAYAATPEASTPIGGTGVDQQYGAGGGDSVSGNPELDKHVEFFKGAGEQWQGYFQDNWKEMLNTSVGLLLGGGRGGGGDTYNISGDPRTVATAIARQQARKTRAQQLGGGMGR